MLSLVSPWVSPKPKYTSTCWLAWILIYMVSVGQVFWTSRNKWSQYNAKKETAKKSKLDQRPYWSSIRSASSKRSGLDSYLMFLSSSLCGACARIVVYWLQWTLTNSKGNGLLASAFFLPFFGLEKTSTLFLLFNIYSII